MITKPVSISDSRIIAVMPVLFENFLIYHQQEEDIQLLVEILISIINGDFDNVSDVFTDVYNADEEFNDVINDFMDEFDETICIDRKKNILEAMAAHNFNAYLEFEDDD